MNVVVTGAAGFIGGEIMLRLKDAGHRVLGIDFAPMPDHLQGVADHFLFDGNFETSRNDTVSPSNW